MKKFALSVLVISSLFLSACSTGYKALSVDKQGHALKSELAYVQPKKVSAPYMTQHATSAPGGLVGILAVAVVNTAINVHAAQQARKRLAAVQNGIQTYDFETNVNKPTMDAIQQTQWLDIKKTTRLSPEEAKALKSSDQNYIVKAEYDYRVISDFTFKNSFFFSMHDPNNPEDKIYKFQIFETYDIPGSKPFDGMDQIGEWEDNNGALIQEAVTQTTKKILEKIKIHLEDPHNKEMREKIDQYYKSKESS